MTARGPDHGPGRTGRADRVRSWRLLGAILVVATVAVACSGTAGTSDRGMAGGSTVPVPPPAPRQGGSLIVAISGETDGFNPTTSQWSGAAVQMARAVLDPLVVMDRDSAWHPYLAKAITPNADFTSWTIDLRPGVTFHNGEILDADALITFLDAVVSSPLSSQGFPERPTITKTGEFSVTLTFTQPWSQMPTVLAEQPGYVIAPAQVRSGDAKHPIGTGPFVFDEWTPDVRFRARRNPTYWREGLPYLDTIELRPMRDPATAQNALRSGEVDVIEIPGAGRPTLDDLAAAGFGVTDDFDNVGVINLIMNTRRGATADRRVREAIVSSIDRDTYRDVVLDPSFVPADQPYAPSSRWHADVAYPAFDPAHGKELVDAYEGEHGPVKLTILTVAGPPQTGPQLVQQQLGAAGIDVTIDSVDVARFIQQFITGDFDAVFIGGFLYAADPDGNYPFLVGRNANGGSAISLNFTGYTNPDLDAAMTAQRRTADPVARQAEWAKVWRILATDLPYAFVAHDRIGFAWKPDVHGLTGFTAPDGTPLPAINHWAPFWTGVYRAPTP